MEHLIGLVKSLKDPDLEVVWRGVCTACREQNPSSWTAQVAHLAKRASDSIQGLCLDCVNGTDGETLKCRAHQDQRVQNQLVR